MRLKKRWGGRLNKKIGFCHASQSNQHGAVWLSQFPTPLSILFEGRICEDEWLSQDCRQGTFSSRQLQAILVLAEAIADAPSKTEIPLKIEETALPGVLIITPRRFGDSRGFFSESWNRAALAEAKIDIDFVQDNHSLGSVAKFSGGQK